MEGFLCAKVNVGEVNKTDVLEIFNVWMQKCVNIVDAIGKLYAKRQRLTSGSPMLLLF